MLTETVPARLAYPGFDLADHIPGGWIKRASVSPSKLPRVGEEQHPCPTNGYLDATKVGYRRRMAWTAHLGDRHVAASLGHVLAVWPDPTVRDRVNADRADSGSAS